MEYTEKEHQQQKVQVNQQIAPENEKKTNEKHIVLSNYFQVKIGSIDKQSTICSDEIIRLNTHLLN